MENSILLTGFIRPLGAKKEMLGFIFHVAKKGSKNLIQDKRQGSF
jgi:hypothetical protein